MKQLGGLSRKFSLIDKITTNDSTPHLLVDSGNFLFRNSKEQMEGTSDSITAAGIAKIYREMNYDAVNIGLNDLSAGIDFIKNMDFLPWVCANYFDRAGKTIFRPYMVKNLGTIKIGIIGLSTAPLRIEQEYVYRSWHEILPVFIAELTQQVDFIILLSSLQESENEEIARLFPSVRLIFSAIARSGNVVPRVVNKALTTQTGNRGRYLGQLLVTNPGLHDWSDHIVQNAEQRKGQKRAIEYRLSRIDLLMRQNEHKPTTLETLGKQKTVLLKQLKNLDQQNKTESGAAKSTYKAVFMPLSQSITGDREIDGLVKNIKEEIESLKKGHSN